MSGKCLIVYYSKTGNTKAMAESIGKGIGADLCEVNEQGKPSVEPTGYGLVVVGTPVNGFSPSIPIKSYLAEYSAKLPAVAFYATYRLHPMGTFGAMEKLAGKRAKATEKFKENDIVQGKVGEKIDAFVAALKK